MKRNILILVLLFASAFPAFAQIENEIQQSKTEKIAKGRAYLLEKFLERDYEKVTEIKDYLLGLEDENYVALAPIELWHILFWTKEYEALTTDLRSMDSARVATFENKVKPARDVLNDQLYRRSVEDEHLLRFGLQDAQLPPEDNDFLTLFLDWDMKPYSPENQAEWNEKSNKFLADYPNSDYEWFVRHFIRVEFGEKAWGLGIGFDLCSGVATGSMAQPVFGIGLNFDFAYKKLLLLLGYDIMAAKTRVDQWIPGGDVCPSGTHVNWMPLYANVGYAVVDNHSIRITPFVGVGGVIETYGTQKHPEYEWLEKELLLYQGGVAFDVKLHGMFEDGHIRVKYTCGMHDIGKETSSMVHLFSVSIGGLSRGVKRVY